ncbi:MAG: long-chain fatty acid--CoA ligase [Deltaproteobacteria bacterium]|nr:long-chain fatty acid--CoA ligase [Deltaproteobacteria bacterium]
MLAASAIIEAAGVIVPIYPTLTAKEAGYVATHSDAKAVFVGDQEHLDKTLQFWPRCGALRLVITLSPDIAANDERVVSFEQVVKEGEADYNADAERERIAAVTEEDVAAIIYTSGTTGVPKGVVLTHGNFLSQRIVPKLFDLAPSDTWLSHLPLCHSFGFVADYMGCLDVGASMGMSEGLDPRSMQEAMRATRPTVLVSVPRLYEKLYLRVLSILDTRPPALQKTFWAAHGVGLAVFGYRNEGKRVPTGLSLKYKAAQVVLGKVKEQAGLDRVRVAYGGGGPLSKDLMAFFNGLGIDIYQGYGLTETSPIATVTVPGDNVLGTVGRAIPKVEIRIDDDGEVLIKGPNVFREYYKDADSTKESFTGDGFFRSGDIGRLDGAGRLMITDRKKELIITSAGKNIAPLGIETAFNTDPYIERLILIGDNRHYLTALVQVDFDRVSAWAKAKGLSFSTNRELVDLPEVTALVQERVDVVNAELARFETIKKFTLVDHEFSEENGVLTPSQKVKRRVVTEKYGREIDAMYGETAKAV